MLRSHGGRGCRLIQPGRRRCTISVVVFLLCTAVAVVTQQPWEWDCCKDFRGCRQLVAWGAARAPGNSRLGFDGVLKIWEVALC
jgi:hypothetical protein